MHFQLGLTLQCHWLAAAQCVCGLCCVVLCSSRIIARCFLMAPNKEQQRAAKSSKGTQLRSARRTSNFPEAKQCTPTTTTTTTATAQPREMHTRPLGPANRHRHFAPPPVGPFRIGLYIDATRWRSSCQRAAHSRPQTLRHTMPASQPASKTDRQEVAPPQMGLRSLGAPAFARPTRKLWAPTQQGSLVGAPNWRRVCALELRGAISGRKSEAQSQTLHQVSDFVARRLSS